MRPLFVCTYLLLRSFSQGNGDIYLLAIALNDQGDSLANGTGLENLVDIRTFRNLLAIDGDDAVANLQAGCLCRTIIGNLYDIDTGVIRAILHLLEGDADIRTVLDIAIVKQLFDCIGSDMHGNGETQTFHFDSRGFCAHDANQFAVAV